MTLADQAPAGPGLDLLFLAFVAGFAVATLIFWPMLERAHNPNPNRGRTSGRHALQRPQHRNGATAIGRIIPDRPQQAAAKAAMASGSTAVTELPDESATTGSNGADQDSQIPVLPTDLYQQHHAAQFEHIRSRLATLRAQLQATPVNDKSASRQPL